MPLFSEAAPATPVIAVRAPVSAPPASCAMTLRQFGCAAFDSAIGHLAQDSKAFCAKLRGVKPLLAIVSLVALPSLLWSAEIIEGGLGLWRDSYCCGLSNMSPSAGVLMLGEVMAKNYSEHK